MSIYDFRIYLQAGEINEEQADALYGRCKDATLITAAGENYLDFDREAESLDEAVRSALGDINAAGFRATHVQFDAEALTPQT